MKVKRLFSSEEYKGEINYLNKQKKYEIARTILYFTLSLSIFFIGFFTTKTRLNLMTVVAVLGCLPACNSAVKMIMFLRYKSLDTDTCKLFIEKCNNQVNLCDLIFTTYEINFQVDHMIICDNTLCGFSHTKDFDEKAFNKHLTNILKMDGFKDITIKIFTNKDKYLERLDQLSLGTYDANKSEAISNTLKSVTL